MSREKVHLFSIMFGMAACFLLPSLAVPSQARNTDDTMALWRSKIETNPAPTMEKRVDTCVNLLRLEMKSPSAPRFGMGGGPIDSGYIQEVLMGSVCTFAQKRRDREKIRSIVTTRLQAIPVKDQAMRDRLTIILGYTGDESVLPRIAGIMEKHSDGYMRCAAALAMREMNCRKYIETLKRVARHDTYTRIRYPGCLDKSGSVTLAYSPVRNDAVMVLNTMRIRMPKDQEVLEAKYGIQCVKPLLYDASNPHCIDSSIGILGAIGGQEAKNTLKEFINKKKGSAGMQQYVKSAQAVLAKLNKGK